MRVFVESGAKKVFAGAIDWPGWARSGKTEEAALDALIVYGPRYKSCINTLAAALTLPEEITDLEVTAHLEGGSGTDFGVPSTIADFDRTDLEPDELDRQVAVLGAAWAAFAATADRAEGRKLASGPRGGGRSLDKIREHVMEAERAYVGALGARPPDGHAPAMEIQDAFMAALEARVGGELPERGPRGGERWPAGYAVRRAAWHVLDHTWEIEDRLGGGPGTT